MVATCRRDGVDYFPTERVSFAPPKPFVQSATWFYTDRSLWVAGTVQEIQALITR